MECPLMLVRADVRPYASAGPDQQGGPNWKVSLKNPVL
jgi:hypothetical protein